MRDNVWFTYKARIQAHHRLEWMEKHSQFLLVWYALLGAILSVFAIRSPNILGQNTDIWGAILSIALLGVSLVVSNLDFRGRTIAMRKNYLSLQRLVLDVSSEQQITAAQRQEYYDLLSEVENHKEIDDKLFRVANHQTLTTRIPTRSEFWQVLFWKLRRLMIIFSLYTAPLFLVWISHECFS
ncbi:SLATT domain-containing protein [Photorhabdus asymbiotica]|uniref:SLATT domain-containing protein n=1 Tax=Photorhabdus asymbiotica TaxID=291112 RepID=UPI003DA71F7F